jgi:transposase
MLIVETIARIRREHFIKGKTIKEIARDLKVSRNTVRKVLRSGETSFEYERAVQPRPKLGRWATEIDGLLAANATKAAREQLTLIRIFEELRERGYDGGYDAVRRYARRWSTDRGQSTAAAYVPLSFAPGEAYQFDWSHEVVLLNGVTVMVKAAHVRLCHSRMLFVRCYPRETLEMVFDAHDRAFALFKGTCGRKATSLVRRCRSKESIRPPLKLADQLLRVGVHEELVGIEAMASVRIERTMDSIAVDRSRTRHRQIAMPHLVGVYSGNWIRSSSRSPRSSNKQSSTLVA